jgi:hypothetical protein
MLAYRLYGLDKAASRWGLPWSFLPTMTLIVYRLDIERSTTLKRSRAKPGLSGQDRVNADRDASRAQRNRQAVRGQQPQSTKPKSTESAREPVASAPGTTQKVRQGRSSLLGLQRPKGGLASFTKLAPKPALRIL